MTTLGPDLATASPAATARSILACPEAVNLVVDGVDDVLADLRGPDGAGELGMQDLAGVPTFSCPSGTRLVDAAVRRRRALLTLESGLGAPGSAERALTLTLGGRLEARGRERCECCDETREGVVLVVDLVVLTPVTGHPDAVPHRVPVEDFADTALVLNPGYLQRSVEHANRCHQDELRRAVATATGTAVSRVIGVALSGLSTGGVEVQWVDPDGSHVRPISFAHDAATPDDLGDLLRHHLHAGLC
ncbi:hypothetical protein GCM10023340_43060 [Nocardioides marinquilinus]|uniref:DUF2470 domain-containing protein n=1 Tax=Nocardioides marinquilinus TaxID=1210400 RepID=A0ABP9Q3I1_9ACTN